MRLFVHLIRRICRIASLELLHAALDGVFCVFPVGILVAVVEFFHHPGYITGQPFHVLFHKGEQDGVEALFLLIGQFGVRSFAQVTKVCKAETFAGLDFLAESPVLLPEVEKGRSEERRVGKECL